MTGYLPREAKTVEHGTPPDLFEKLEARWGPFDLDVAASDDLHVCPFYFTRELSGLEQPWRGRVYVNVPGYDVRSVSAWLTKARAELQSGRAILVCALLPAKTDRPWFHEHVWDRAACRARPGVLWLDFIEGRLTFVGSEWQAPFPSMVVVFGRIEG